MEFSFQVCCGMGSAIANMHKDIYKAARHSLTDRVMAVRCAASKVYLVLSFKLYYFIILY